VQLPVTMHDSQHLKVQSIVQHLQGSQSAIPNSPLPCMYCSQRPTLCTAAGAPRCPLQAAVLRDLGEVTQVWHHSQPALPARRALRAGQGVRVVLDAR
jgi:hypothetical protein